VRRKQTFNGENRPEAVVAAKPTFTSVSAFEIMMLEER